MAGDWLCASGITPRYRWRRSFKDSVEFKGLPGRIPGRQEVAAIIKRAKEPRP